MVLDLEQGLLLFGVLETVEMALAGELADGPALEGGDPRDAVAFAQGLDGGLDDHAAVSDHHHLRVFRKTDGDSGDFARIT